MGTPTQRARVSKAARLSAAPLNLNPSTYIRCKISEESLTEPVNTDHSVIIQALSVSMV